MKLLLKKYKYLLIGGISLVILAYTLDPTVEFILKLIDHSKDHSISFNPHWWRFTNNADCYVIEFPSRPFEYHDNDDTITNSAAVSFHRYASVFGTNNDGFMVATVTDSFTNKFSPDQINLILDKVVKGALETNSQLLAEKNITLDSYLGREIEIQKAGKFHIKARYYKIGNKLQTLLVSVPLKSQDLQSNNVSHFFDSFRLIPK
jgi:hypothetical protein